MKGQDLRLYLGDTPTAVTAEKSVKLSYSNEFEDSTTKDTPTGQKSEEFIRNNVSISFDKLVGELSELESFKDAYQKGEKISFVVKTTGTSSTTVESGKAVFDSFDIDATDRQNVSASGSMHKVYVAAS